MSKKAILNKAIKENRIVPMTVKGDSMQPEYYTGDIVLVDTDYKNPVGGGEFFIEGENIGMNVIRADDCSKGIQLIYTNKMFNDYVMDYNEFASIVKGRVVGHIQSMLLTETKCNPIVLKKLVKEKISN